jgi:hypothetical protein
MLYRGPDMEDMPMPQTNPRDLDRTTAGLAIYFLGRDVCYSHLFIEARSGKHPVTSSAALVTLEMSRQRF